MSSTKTFKNVSPAIWKCIKETSIKEHGSVFSPPDASTGTVTTVVKTLGLTFTVELSFNYDQVKEQVTYIINERPKLVVSENDIWDGIQRTIDGCKKSGGGG